MGTPTLRCALPAALLAMLALLAVPIARSQTVYRCAGAAGTAYSNEPCLGGRAVDIQPPQGLDRASGESRKSPEVIRSEKQQAMAQALGDLLGEAPEQVEKRHRRFGLAADARASCARLDSSLVLQEAAARRAGPEHALRAQQGLYASRLRYRELGC